MHADAKQAVSTADASSMTKWASRYEHGDGIKQDIDLAIALNCFAGSLGNSDAAYNLGWIYANGRGGARNDSLAALWMDRAAKNGDSQPSVYSYVWESHQMLSPNHAFCPAVRL